jgi:hypothetical protein
MGPIVGEERIDMLTWLAMNGSNGWRSTNGASFLRLYGSSKMGDH